jgi:hypothetical protein
MRRAPHLLLLTLVPALGAVGCSAQVDSSGWVFVGKWSPEPNAMVWVDVEFVRSLQHPMVWNNSPGIGCRFAAQPKDAGGYWTGSDPATGPTDFYDYLSGGIVTIAADQTITMVPQADPVPRTSPGPLDHGPYTVGGAPVDTASVFHPGQVVSVEIAGNGGDPPAVSLSYTAPGQVEVTTPAGSAFDFDRTLDATFTWTPTSGDVVLVDFNDYGLSCEWPMDKGRGSVPAALLSRLPAGAATATFTGGTRQVEDHGRWRMHAGAYASATSVPVTFR